MLALSNRWLVQWLVIILALVTVQVDKETVIVSWTPGGDNYQWHMVRGVWLDKTPEEVTEWTRVDKPAISLEVKRYRSGHFAIEIKACKKAIDGKERCSSTIRSDVVGEGKPNPWIIFWKPPKPTNIIIEDERSR